MHIRTDIPLPTDEAPRGGRSSVYPFDGLPIGGSFAVPLELAQKTATAARMWRQRHPGWDFVARRLDNEFRVWRKA